MAFPALPIQILSASKRRNWIRHNIKLETWNTQTATSIYETIKGTAVGIRKTDFLKIRREILEVQRYEEQFRTLKGDTLAPRSWMQEKPRGLMTMKSQYRFHLRATNIETGESEPISRAIATNQHYTKDEAQAFIEDWYVDPSETSNYVVDQIELYEVWIEEGATLDRGLR